jgi:hypothetical protein
MILDRRVLISGGGQKTGRWGPIIKDEVFGPIRDMKKAGRNRPFLAFYLFVQLLSLVAGEGLEPPTSGL